MKELIIVLHKFFSRSTNFIYWNYIRFRSLLFARSEVKFLFSNTMGESWEKNIRHGFECTKHKFDFRKFTSGVIKNYGCVVPISIDDLIFTDRVRNWIPNNPVPIPSKESILLCDDKYLFNTSLIKKGMEILFLKWELLILTHIY